MKRIILIAILAIAMLNGIAASIEVRSYKGANDSIYFGSHQLNILVKTYTYSTFDRFNNGIFMYRSAETYYPEYVTFRMKDSISFVFWEVLLEPTDSIVVTLDKNNRGFASGRGSEKWQCRLAMYALYDALNLKEKLYTNGEAVANPINWPDLFEKSKRIVRYFDSGMSQLAKTCLTVDYFSMMADNRIYALTALMRRHPAMDRSWIRQEVKGLIDYSNQLFKTFSDSLLSMSYYFSLMLKDATIMEKIKIDNKVEDLETLYNAIISEYNGLTCNSMIMQLLIRYRKEEKFYQLAQKTVPRLTDPRHISILSRIVNAEKLGKPIQFASFTNVAGKKVSLNSFKDTVVLLDLWFTGCKACVALHKAMAPLEERMKGKAFKMITVSIDKDLDMWKASVENGIYTNPKDLNLNTAGEGGEHPFFKHYQIMAYPTLILIDKQGNLASTAVADPRFNKFEEIISSIETLL